MTSILRIIVTLLALLAMDTSTERMLFLDAGFDGEGLSLKLSHYIVFR